MKAVQLYPHQKQAVEELEVGKILWGDVGTGKSLTAMYFFFTKICGGVPGDFGSVRTPMDVIVITTAKKRDSLDWEKDAGLLGITKWREGSVAGIQLTVDSWNNINKYKDVENAFFIFDEQRLVGSGAWTQAFIKIARNHPWILLSATPGDTWLDYIPVFIANGWYKNRTEFKREHVIYSTYTKFPKVERYIGTGKLVKYRNHILVYMPFERHTKRHMLVATVGYDKELLETAMKYRWHVYEERPLQGVAELFGVMRKIVNSDPSRLWELKKAMAKHPRLIVFYNFDYELEALREGLEGVVEYAEWNGHKHQDVPNTDKWVYLVQYAAGAEGWNCTTTDAMLFFSLTYSYKHFHQSMGRIDRLNTKFIDLFYTVLKSSSPIDNAVWKALQTKKSFNEKDYAAKTDIPTF